MTFKVEDNDLKPEDKVMINNSTLFKYETPHKGQFVITRYFTVGTVNCSMVKSIWSSIRQIKPYKSDTNVEDINPENMYEKVNI